MFIQFPYCKSKKCNLYEKNKNGKSKTTEYFTQNFFQKNHLLNNKIVYVIIILSETEKGVEYIE